MLMIFPWLPAHVLPFSVESLSLVKVTTWFYLPRFMSKKWLDWNIQGRELERVVLYLKVFMDTVNPMDLFLWPQYWRT